MRYKKKGFTIIESLTYIFLTTLILAEGINMFISMYKSYLESCKLTYKYNSIQNFYTNLNNIICEESTKNLLLGSDYICFTKDDSEEEKYDLNKTIQENKKTITVTYSRNGNILTANNMLKDINRMEIKKKNNLIYMIFYDNDGKEFISCI